MAKRPDFTQKLLDDLRRRKERMLTSQRSEGSNQISSAEKYRNFKQASLESRENIGSSSVTQLMQKFYDNGHTTSFALEGSSKDVVLVGKAHTSGSFVDLSMAIAYAQNNGGRHNRTGSSSHPMSGLPQDFRRLMDFGVVDGKSVSDKSITLNGQFPMLSHLQIKEISKGAQKLNQILKVCYNGLDVDKYSVEIGKELLKGAINLEESLRMLVNLQEASEKMLSSQKKQRIKLVEVDDNDGDGIEEVEKQKKLDRPKFSFDKPSRTSHEDVREVTKTSSLVMQKLLDLTPTKTMSINSGNQPKLSHRRSASCGAPSTISTFSNQEKNPNSDFQQERRRLPSVIAKLMGLEELPPSTNSNTGAHKESGVKQGTTVDPAKNLQDSSKKQETVIKNSEKISSQTARQRVPQANNLETPDTNTLYADKLLVNQNHTLKAVIHEKSTLRKVQREAEMLVDKHEKKRRQGIQNPGVQQNTRRGKTKEKFHDNDLQTIAPQLQKHAEGGAHTPERSGTKEAMLSKDTRNADFMLLKVNNQQKHMLNKSKSEVEKFKVVEREQKNTKNKLHSRKPKRTEMLPKRNSSKPANNTVAEKLTHKIHGKLARKSEGTFEAMTSKASNRHHEDLIRDVNATNLEVAMKEVAKESTEDQSPSSSVKEKCSHNVAAPVVQTVIQKDGKVTSTENILDKVDMLQSVVPRKIEEDLSRKNGPNKNGKTLQRNVFVLQDPEQERYKLLGKSNEAKESVRLSKEEGESIQQLMLAQDVQNNSELSSVMKYTKTKHYEGMKEQEAVTANSIPKMPDIIERVFETIQATKTLPHEDRVIKTSEIISVQSKDLHESSPIDISKCLLQKQQDNPKSETPGLLTESEYQLKQIFLKSQLFLNAAEALFKLQIPVGILHNSINYCREEDSRLILDCGYEVMKSKGKIQELSYYPCVNISIVSKKVNTLDDLVKELHEDLETFFDDEDGSIEYDAADYHLKLLHRDIHNKKPDINCMWDCGWNNTMFACLEKEEIIKDLSAHVLDRMIDQITRDLLHVSLATDKRSYNSVSLQSADRINEM